MAEAVERAALAAYHNLTCRAGGEEACQQVGRLVAVELDNLRAYHGMGYMLQLEQSWEQRWPIVDRVYGLMPKIYKVGMSREAVHDAVGAAARVLAKG